MVLPYSDELHIEYLSRLFDNTSECYKFFWFKAIFEKVIAGDTAGISKQTEWQGGGSFVYCELAELNQKYIDQLQDAKDEKTLESIWENIKKTGFISCYVNPADIDESSSDFKELSLDDKKRLFLDMLDLNQLYVNYCDIDDETFGISDADKAFTKSLYGDN